MSLLPAQALLHLSQALPCQQDGGEEGGRTGWLKSLHSGLFTNSTVLLGHDRASSL